MRWMAAGLHGGLRGRPPHRRRRSTARVPRLPASSSGGRGHAAACRHRRNDNAEPPASARNTPPVKGPMHPTAQPASRLLARLAGLPLAALAAALLTAPAAVANSYHVDLDTSGIIANA